MRSITLILGCLLVACGDDDTVSDVDSPDAALDSEVANDSSAIDSALETTAEDTVPEVETTPADEVVIEGATVRIVDGNGDGTVVLSDAIRVPTGGTLDCEGLRLVPATPPPSADDETPSAPEVAVLLAEIDGARVSDCVIDGFDFGVFVGGGGSHVISDNTITARNTGIFLLASSDNTVNGNTIAFGAVGVGVFRDADDNVVSANDITQTVNLGWHHLVPGDAFGFAEGMGVMVLDGPVPEVAVVVATIGDVVLRYPASAATVDDTIISTNTITVRADNPGARVGPVYSAVRSNRTVIRGNTLTNGQGGVTLPGFDDGFAYALPGVCALDVARPCRGELVADDCSVTTGDAALGACRFVDASDVALGVCELSGDPCRTIADCDPSGDEGCGRTAPSGGTLRVQEPLIEDNIIRGAAYAGVDAFLTRSATIRNNDIAESNVGIALAAYSIASATVSQNRVHDNAVGLRIESGVGVETFAATVAENDFVDNEQAVVSNVVALLGSNYWGRESCPGFLAADASGLAADCAPFVVPVAESSEGATPCASESRPHELDGVCVFDAPAKVSGGASGALTFEVEVGFSGAYSAQPAGLVAGVARPEATVMPGALPSFVLPLPAGTRHLRVALAGDDRHDLDLILFDGTCEEASFDCDIIAAPFLAGSNEVVDISGLGIERVHVAVDPFFVDGDVATYTIATWLVVTGPATLFASAPADVTAGTEVEVALGWPTTLAPGTWLGVISHANAFGPLRTTLVEVMVTP